MGCYTKHKQKLNELINTLPTACRKLLPDIAKMQARSIQNPGRAHPLDIFWHVRIPQSCYLLTICNNYWHILYIGVRLCYTMKRILNMYLVENTIIDRGNRLPLSHVTIKQVLTGTNIKPFESLNNKDVHRDLFKTKKEAEQFAMELDNE